MNDDGTNIIVSQQRRDLVFGDWASAAIFVPRRVWIGDKLLHHLLRCYFRAVLGEHRPQSRQQLYSDAWLIWSAREVNRRPTCLLGPTTTSMLRNLQQQFPISTQPIVKTWRLQRLQVLDDTDVVGRPPCELAPIVENSGSSAYAKSSAFSSGFLGHILRIILRLAIVRGNLVLPRMPRIFGQNGSYQRPCRGILVSQQRRNLVFGDWASAAIFVPRRVWIGDKLLHHLLRCYFRAVLGEHRPQSRQQLYSDAWLIWSAREENRRPTCLLGPTTTSTIQHFQFSRFRRLN